MNGSSRVLAALISLVSILSASGQLHYVEHFEGAVENQIVDIRGIDWQIHESNGTIPPTQSEYQSHTLQFGDAPDGDNSFFRRTTTGARPFVVWTNTASILEAEIPTVAISWIISAFSALSYWDGIRAFVAIEDEGWFHQI